MCAQEASCVPRLLAIFLRHPVKVGFDVRISLILWIRAVFSKVEDSIFFVFLDFISVWEEQPFSHTKSKASAFE